MSDQEQQQQQQQEDRFAAPTTSEQQEVAAATTEQEKKPAAESTEEESEKNKEGEGEGEGETKKEAPAAPVRRKVNTGIFGNIITNAVVSNLPAGQKPVPEWKRKALEREAVARGETIPERKEGEEGEQRSVDGGLYRPPHQRLPPAPLVSQQAQERSAFPGDFWFHKEIENLIGKHRRKVHIRENEDDAFFDRGGKAGRGVIASYIVDAFPLVRNARPRHIREAMAAGEIFPDNTKIEIIDESDRKIKPGDDDYEEDEDVREVRIGGGIEDDY